MNKECNICEPQIKCKQTCKKVTWQTFSDGFSIPIFSNIDACKKRKKIINEMSPDEYVVFVKRVGK